jgi:hypothetical protein
MSRGQQVKLEARRPASNPFTGWNREPAHPSIAQTPNPRPNLVAVHQHDAALLDGAQAAPPVLRRARRERVGRRFVGRVWIKLTSPLRHWLAFPP